MATYTQAEIAVLEFGHGGAPHCPLTQADTPTSYLEYGHEGGPFVALAPSSTGGSTAAHQYPNLLLL